MPSHPVGTFWRAGIALEHRHLPGNASRVIAVGKATSNGMIECALVLLA